MSADVIYGIDFRNKKKFEPVESPVETGIKTILAQGLECPAEVLAIIWADHLAERFHAPEKDPA